MPSFSGKYRYLDADGGRLQDGACRFSFDGERFTLAPPGGAPLAGDLADIDIFSPGEYELRLRLYTGRTILLTHFSKDFQNLCRDLLEAWRTRLIPCLLLEDLEEIARFDGFAQLDASEDKLSGRAEIRLYKSNLVVLPESANGFSWRLADIESFDFDEATYTLGLRSGQDRLILTRLAKRTREFIDKLQDAMTRLSEKSVSVLQDLFAFLTPDQTREIAGLAREGRAVPVSKLMAIHRRTEEALLKRAVDKSLLPYFTALKKELAGDEYYCGFKFIRPEADAEEPEEQAEEIPVEAPDTLAGEAPPPEENADSAGKVEGDGTERADPVLHWFFLPMRAGNAGAQANIVAWEAASRGGRATYFFRLLPQDQSSILKDKTKAAAAVSEAVRRLNGAIILLNFRREPIYLPDDSLSTQPRFHRYAIACRKIPALRQLRASFLGRAMHTSPEAWQKQVQTIISKG